MSDEDDAIRRELHRLVRPADTADVMAALTARRSVAEPRRRSGWLVAAAVIAVLGLAGVGLVSSCEGAPSVTAGAGQSDVPGWLPSVVPDGADLVSVHTFAPGEWQAPVEPWATPGLSTLSYRDLTDPMGQPSFDVEVFPDLALDVDAALAGLGDDSETVRVGGAAGVRVRGPGTGSTSDRIIWQAGGSVMRIDANGIAPDEVLAIAASVRAVDEATWAEALAGADVAPPYGFRGETAVVSGGGWSITAGRYRQPFGLPTGCAVLEIDAPGAVEPEAGDPSCVSPFPVLAPAREETVLDVRHVWVGGRLVVWGLPVEGARSVRLVYDEGTFEASLDRTGGVMRTEQVPGEDTFVFAAELDVARRPSRVEVLDAAGSTISTFEDQTSRALPARPDGLPAIPSVTAPADGLVAAPEADVPTTDPSTATTVLAALPALEDQQITIARSIVSAFVDECRRGDLTSAAGRWNHPYVAPGDPSGELSALAELVDDRSFARILEGETRVDVSDSWGVLSTAPVVTVMRAREGDAPPVAFAFLVGALPASAGQDPREVMISSIPEVAPPEADPPPGSFVSPGQRVRVPGTPLEGGVRGFVDGEEISVDVDFERREMTFLIPDRATGDIAVTLSVASPELPVALAFAYTVR